MGGDGMMVGVSSTAEAFVQRCVDGRGGCLYVHTWMGGIVECFRLDTLTTFRCLIHPIITCSSTNNNNARQGGGQRAAVPAALRRGRLPGIKHKIYAQHKACLLAGCFAIDDIYICMREHKTMAQRERVCLLACLLAIDHMYACMDDA